MKILITLTLTSLLFSQTMTTTHAAEAANPTPAPAPAAKPAPRKAGGHLHHMVAFKFKPGTSSEDIRKVEDAFAALPSKIAQIATYDAGTNVSPEKLDKGFTHGFLLSFRSSKDRDDYLVHPDHQEFGRLIGPSIADVFVLDFWSGSPMKKADPAAPAAKTGARPAKKAPRKTVKPDDKK